MDKYKICPSCHAKNDPVLFECAYCETDLTRVAITDENTDLMLEDTKSQHTDTPVMVRICDCGTKNPANARKCSACGEDISDILPTPDITSAVEPDPTPAAYEFVVSSLDGQYAYKLTEPEVTIGREQVMSDYLSSKMYVSRIHAKLLIENNELYIENLSHTNFTFLNNQRITERTKLEDGDELGLGGIHVNGVGQEQAAYFLVRICPCM